MWYPFFSQNPARSVSSNSIAVSHLALFQAYSRGTINRAGPPCSTVRGAPSCNRATSASSARKSASGRFVVQPLSKPWTRTKRAAGFHPPPLRTSSRGDGLSSPSTQIVEPRLRLDQPKRALIVPLQPRFAHFRAPLEGRARYHDDTTRR